MIWQLTIRGIPRTKKTSMRIVTRRSTGKPFVIGSATTRGWAETAILQLRSQWHRPALDVAVAVRALIYRDRNVGDATNFYQAIGDVLQDAGVIENDRLIEHWDGSRRLKDAENPRVEVFLSTVKDSA